MTTETSPTDNPPPDASQLTRDLLDTITSGSPQEAWDAIGQSLWDTFSAPITDTTRLTPPW